LLSSISTKIMLNGSIGDRIYHDGGIRQGDPSSPCSSSSSWRSCMPLSRKRMLGCCSTPSTCELFRSGPRCIRMTWSSSSPYCIASLDISPHQAYNFSFPLLIQHVWHVLEKIFHTLNNYPIAHPETPSSTIYFIFLFNFFC
jgi:hypothetical protein